MSPTSRKLAGTAKKPPSKVGRPPARPQTALEHQWTKPEMALLELVARGMAVSKAAIALLDQIQPNKSRPQAYRERNARRWARNTARQLWFRDALWDNTTTAVDLATPRIMNGMVKSAIRGRVDAAKLALAVAGRYSDHADKDTAVNVQVVFAEIPRPDRHIELPPGDVEEL